MRLTTSPHCVRVTGMVACWAAWPQLTAGYPNSKQLLQAEPLSGLAAPSQHTTMHLIPEVRQAGTSQCAKPAHHNASHPRSAPSRHTTCISSQKQANPWALALPRGQSPPSRKKQATDLPCPTSLGPCGLSTQARREILPGEGGCAAVPQTSAVGMAGGLPRLP